MARSVEEDSPYNTAVGDVVTATDEDASQDLFYEAVGGTGLSLFGVKLCSGQIFVAAETLVPDSKRYSLIINATDTGTPPMFALTTVEISITFINHAPTFTNTSLIFTVAENQPVGTLLSPSTAYYYEQDANDTTTWSIISDPFAAFKVNASTGVLSSAKVHAHQ
jgi:hypothetical protein